MGCKKPDGPLLTCQWSDPGKKIASPLPRGPQCRCVHPLPNFYIVLQEPVSKELPQRAHSAQSRLTPVGSSKGPETQKTMGPSRLKIMFAMMVVLGASAVGAGQAGHQSRVQLAEAAQDHEAAAAVDLESHPQEAMGEGPNRLLRGIRASEWQPVRSLPVAAASCSALGSPKELSACSGTSNTCACPSPCLPPP